jgi:DNA modification methylase
MLNKIYNGDCFELIKQIPDEFIDCIVTSPPYWNLRDYGVEGQFGLEKNFSDYINKLLFLFDEVKRILKPTGTCWVNLGDTYGGSGNSSGHTPETDNLKRSTFNYGATKGNMALTKDYVKSLIGIPDRFKIGMIDRGWKCSVIGV